MHTIKEMNVDNKNIILRCDFNVPIENSTIKDNSKIVKSLKTINYLLEKNCKIIILSHFGRVKKDEDKMINSLEPVAIELSNLLQKKVKFINKCYGDDVKKIVDNSNLGEVILLQNTRFMDIYEQKESNNDLELAKFFASLGDIFINDAFASLHRAHASTAGIAKFLPSAVGFLVEDELSNLDILIKNTPYPFTVFMGGAKVDDKLPIIKSLVERCDYLLLGGGVANSFLKAIGADVEQSLATSDKDILKEIKELIYKYKEKIVLPEDFIIENNAIYDLDIKSIEKFKTYINKSNIIFVNGTCGKFEDERFKKGTEKLFEALYKSGKRVIIGGGDTANAAKTLGYTDKFNYISSGGGATLEYIANKKLVALEWMK